MVIFGQFGWPLAHHEHGATKTAHIIIYHWVYSISNHYNICIELGCYSYGFLPCILRWYPPGLLSMLRLTDFPLNWQLTPVQLISYWLEVWTIFVFFG